MKSSQVLIETANNVAKLNKLDNTLNHFGCLEIQKVLKVLPLISDFNSVETEYYKQFGNPKILKDKNNNTWFAPLFSSNEYYITNSQLNEMRILALCFASYIAHLEGN